MPPEAAHADSAANPRQKNIPDTRSTTYQP